MKAWQGDFQQRQIHVFAKTWVFFSHYFFLYICIWSVSLLISFIFNIKFMFCICFIIIIDLIFVDFRFYSFLPWNLQRYEWHRNVRFLSRFPMSPRSPCSQGSYTFFVRKFHDFSRIVLVFPEPTLSKLSTSISEILSNHIIYHVLTFVYEYIRNYPS